MYEWEQQESPTTPLSLVFLPKNKSVLQTKTVPVFLKEWLPSENRRPTFNNRFLQHGSAEGLPKQEKTFFQKDYLQSSVIAIGISMRHLVLSRERSAHNGSLASEEL